MIWPFRKILILGLAMLMPAIEGCSYIGPNSLNVERRRYNDVIQKTNDEELLLNLVRMRYNDRPSFLSVNSITSSLSSHSIRLLQLLRQVPFALYIEKLALE